MPRAPLWDCLVHLRLNFQLMLAPIFLWGALLARGVLDGRLLLAFALVHLCLYGGVTAYNSVFDRDEGPVGGLKRPPPVPSLLLPFSLAVLLVGALAAFAVGAAFGLVYIAGLLLGLGYSHPRTRWKARPWASLLVVAFGQGVLGCLTGYLAAGGRLEEAGTRRVVEGVAVATLFTTCLYPLTQVYQIEEDRARGDRTFAVAFGPAACFGVSTGGAALAGLLLLAWGWRTLSPAEALFAAASALGAAGYLAAWSRRYRPEEVERNYARVMAIGYATALALGLLILGHLLSGVQASGVME